MASAAKSRMTDATVLALIEARHDDPFAVLGPHEIAGGIVIRALVPGATRVEVIEEATGKTVGELKSRHEAGLFEGVLKNRPAWFGYLLRAQNDGGSWELHDPYRFPPVLGEMDDYLIHEGTHRRLWERLGAHAIEHANHAGRPFRGLGTRRRAGLGRRRLQWLGRPAQSDASARRRRRLGDLHPRARRGCGLQIRTARRRRHAPAAEG